MARAMTAGINGTVGGIPAVIDLEVLIEELDGGDRLFPPTEPDPGWRYVDAAGHEHAYGPDFTTPTLHCLPAEEEVTARIGSEHTLKIPRDGAMVVMGAEGARYMGTAMLTSVATDALGATVLLSGVSELTRTAAPPAA